MRNATARAGAAGPRQGGILDQERIGLCWTCAHARRVTTPRSTFWLCGLSATDPRFVRYPRLPVLRCAGWKAGEPEREEPPPGTP